MEYIGWAPFVLCINVFILFSMKNIVVAFAEDEVHTKFKGLCALNGITMREFFDRIIRKAVDKQRVPDAYPDEEEE